MNGWIKLHRALKENPIYKESKAVHCWIECLLRASHKDKEIYLKRDKIKLDSGMFVMGREEFGKSVGMAGSTAWYWLSQFEKNSMVDIKKTAKGSIITIIAWDEYQQVDSRKTAEKQQKNTYNNVKNVKNKDKRLKDSMSKQVLTPSQFKNHYNKIAKRLGFSLVRKLSSTRRKKIKTRVANFREDIFIMFKELKKQEYLKKESWFGIDFIIRNNKNIEKIINHWMAWKYEDKKSDYEPDQEYEVDF